MPKTTLTLTPAERESAKAFIIKQFTASMHADMVVAHTIITVARNMGFKALANRLESMYNELYHNQNPTA
jgi:hypothetical protein